MAAANPNQSGLTISVAQPPVFLGSPGDPPVSFKLWRKMVENYFVAILFQNPSGYSYAWRGGGDGHLNGHHQAGFPN